MLPTMSHTVLAESCEVSSLSPHFHEKVEIKDRLKSSEANPEFKASLVSLLSLCSSSELIIKMKLFSFQINKYF